MPIIKNRPQYECKLADIDLETVDVDGSFSGYASIFDERDLGNDIITKGAFAKSLKKRGSLGVRMLFQHNPETPIGVWQEITENNHGLYVRGKLAILTKSGAEVHQLLKAGAIDGLSIGFKTLRAQNRRTHSARHILEADLWEISVVTFPMQPGARVENIKHDTGQHLPSRREFERWLTRDAGLTRREARTIMQKGFNHLASTQDAAGINEAFLIDRIRQAATTMLAGEIK